MTQQKTILPKLSLNIVSRQKYASMNIMIVEDTSQMSGLICGILKSLGVGHILEARSGRDALDIMQLQAVDLVLTDDLKAPMDGLALAREIRKSKTPEIATLPIVYITSRLQKSAIMTARDAGVTEILSKPFSATQMITRIEAALIHPRPIIKAQDFTGPDRRRKVNERVEQRRTTDKDVPTNA